MAEMMKGDEIAIVGEVCLSTFRMGVKYVVAAVDRSNNDFIIDKDCDPRSVL
jgi:hypothetical protein